MESDHLLTKLQELTADLLFISESESYLEVTRGSDPDLGKSVLADLSQRQVSPDSLVMTETEAFFEALFFAPEDDEIMKDLASHYRALYAFLEEAFSEIAVFRAFTDGPVHIYIVAGHPQDFPFLIHTEAVET